MQKLRLQQAQIEAMGKEDAVKPGSPSTPPPLPSPEVIQDIFAKLQVVLNASQPVQEMQRQVQVVVLGTSG